MPSRSLFNRRPLLSVGLSLSLALASVLPADAATQLRIGYQKSSTLISLLKSNGDLEKALAKQDVSISWHEFPNGQPLLEAQAIIVRDDSPLRSVAQLKGKKVAVTKAAGSHYLLLAALAKAGLKFSDIEPAYLTPADGRAAFENRKVDAWVTWEPFLSGAQQQLPTRTLADGKQLADYQRYYLTSTAFAKNNPQVLAVVFDELVKTGDWLRANPRAAAQVLSPLWGGLDPAIVEQANARRSYQVRLVQPQSLKEQQKIADAFVAEGLLPNAVNALDVAIWKAQ